MDHTVMTDETGSRMILTTDSSASHYGIPVLRVEDSDDLQDVPDLGPANTFLARGVSVPDKTPAETLMMLSRLTAADVVAAWGKDPARTDEERHAAALFLGQWPDGPQIPAR